MTALTCRDAVEFLADYLAGELPPERREPFERHLAECDECVAYLSRYEHTVRLVKAAFDDCLDEPAGARLPKALIDAIVASRRSGT